MRKLPQSLSKRDSLKTFSCIGDSLPEQYTGYVRACTLGIKSGIQSIVVVALTGRGRLMTMSPLYPCGTPYSRGTHNEKVKNLALFTSIINGIVMESRLRISIPWERFQLFNRIENLHRNNSNPQISQSNWYRRNHELGLIRARFLRVML